MYMYIYIYIYIYIHRRRVTYITTGAVWCNNHFVMASAGAQAYVGGLAPVGSRGKALVGGQRGKAPLKLSAFLVCCGKNFKIYS